MTDILALLQCLNPELEKTTLRQMSRIIPALLAMTGHHLWDRKRRELPNRSALLPYSATVGNAVLAFLPAPFVAA